jgi:ornithine cyclodeaminase/alanine dehydrogenase-like protein (mu-crystallin family)
MQILNDNDIREAVQWSDVLHVLEQAFKVRYHNPNAFTMPERVGINSAQGTYLTMPCADSEGWFGVKQVSVVPANPSRGKPSVQAWYTLFDTTGTPVLACSATLLTKFRTSAVSAIAAKYLASPGATTLLVLGTGSLAPWMAQAHRQVRTYEKILVWGRNPEKALTTAHDIQKRLNQPVEVTHDLEAAIKQADVITVATTSRLPIIKGEWIQSSRLQKGQHIDLVGAFVPEMIEVDAETVKGSSIFVDDILACQAEAGDLIQAAKHGWSWTNVRGDLAAVVSGKVERGDVTLFKSVGLALEDLVVAKLLVSM